MAAALCVHAIVPAAATSLESGDPPVRRIANGRLAALVGPSPSAAFHALPREVAARRLVDHQRVVEAAMGASAMLPVKFGTVLPDEAAVLRLLERGAPVLAPRLDEFSGHMQIDVAVSWNLEDVLREIAAEAEIARLKSAAEAPPGAAGDARIALGRAVKAAIERRRAAYGGVIAAGLRPIATDLLGYPADEDRTVANLALLLRRSASRHFDDRLARLDAELDGRLHFRCIGPMPPYAFATVEIDLPRFEIIDKARRALQLGEQAGAEEIKSAYRRLIKEVHPDRQAAVGDGPARALIDAYRLLLRYVEGAGRLDAAAGGCRFDRDAVERTILVAVRRQEPASRGERQG